MIPAERPPAQPPSADELAWRLKLLLTHAGMQQPCSKCGASVFWLQNQGRQADAEPSAFDISGFDHLKTCPETGEELVAALGDVQHLYKALEAALSSVGDAGRCGGCGARVWWVQHIDSGKRAPYTPEGLNHFSDCPKAAAFRKGA